MKDNLQSENEKYEIMRLIQSLCEIKDLKQKSNEKQLKLLSILCNQKILCFSCVCIKCFKSAKKNSKNVKLLTKEDTFG